MSGKIGADIRRQAQATAQGGCGGEGGPVGPRVRAQLAAVVHTYQRSRGRYRQEEVLGLKRFRGRENRRKRWPQKGSTDARYQRMRPTMVYTVYCIQDWKRVGKSRCPGHDVPSLSRVAEDVRSCTFEVELGRRSDLGRREV